MPLRTLNIEIKVFVKAKDFTIDNITAVISENLIVVIAIVFDNVLLVNIM